MHSVGLNIHGNPHLTARGPQQPEPTDTVNPVPSSDDEGDDGSFGAAVTVTLSANAKAHMATSSEDGGQGSRPQSTAHQARGLMAGAGFTAGGVPFGKIVSEIARFGLEAATTLFNPTPVEDEGEGESTEIADEPLAAAPLEEGAEGDQGGEGTAEVALAPAPVPPLEDLLLEEGLLAPTAGDAEPSIIEELLDPDTDDPEVSAV